MNERAPLPRTRLEGPSRRLSGTRGLARSERGTAIVEFALIAPLLFFLVFGIIEFGRALNYYNDLTQLAGQGARAAIVSRNPDSTAVGTANANCAANNQTIQCQIAKTFPTDNQLKTGMSACLGTLNTSTGVITAPTTRADHRGSGHPPDEVPVPLFDEPLRRLDHLDLDANRAARGPAHLGRGQRRRHRRERVPAMRSHRSPESERGAVIVMVAIWLPVLALFVSFAVDFAHFFDYSRNLQNRADAAALAASVAYGNTCFSTPTAAQTDAIGKVAQQYAGPPIQNAGSPYTVPNNLPYAYSAFTQSQYLNVPKLTKGTPQNFHMRLNSTRNWPNGANWEMGTTGHNTNSTGSLQLAGRGRECRPDDRRPSHAGEPGLVLPVVQLQSVDQCSRARRAPGGGEHQRGADRRRRYRQYPLCLRPRWSTPPRTR